MSHNNLHVHSIDSFGNTDLVIKRHEVTGLSLRVAASGGTGVYCPLGTALETLTAGAVTVAVGDAAALEEIRQYTWRITHTNGTSSVVTTDIAATKFRGFDSFSLHGTVDSSLAIDREIASAVGNCKCTVAGGVCVFTLDTATLTSTWHLTVRYAV